VHNQHARRLNGWRTKLEQGSNATQLSYWVILRFHAKQQRWVGWMHVALAIPLTPLSTQICSTAAAASLAGTTSSLSHTLSPRAQPAKSVHGTAAQQQSWPPRNPLNSIIHNSGSQHHPLQPPNLSSPPLAGPMQLHLLAAGGPNQLTACLKRVTCVRMGHASDLR
jgi:hypothetical protein